MGFMQGRVLIESGNASTDTLEMQHAAALGPWLLEIGSPDGGSCMLLRPGDRVVLGSGKEADVRVADPTVSHRHCSLKVEADRVEIEDLASKNGLYVGAMRVRRAAATGDTSVLVIGRSSVVLRSSVPDALPHADPIAGIIGSSQGMQRVIAEVRRHCRTRAPVLLQGESGTGKDVLARSLHQLSRRAGTYVPLNVGALPETLADSELFGHRRGAFTGAVQSRPGAFEQAQGGTLFLDEIADLPLAVQVKLLRVVEDGHVRPLGATSTIHVDVRIVSASWADLDRRVAEGRFRSDLYHRLSTVVVHVPPLRQRRSDIPELGRSLLRRIRGEVGDKELTSAALAKLVSYAWPGNVRELGSVLYRAAMSAGAEVEIRAEHISMGGGPIAPQRALALGPDDARALLEEHAGNVSSAARAAGVPRSTFRSWLARPQEGEGSARASDPAAASSELAADAQPGAVRGDPRQYASGNALRASSVGRGRFGAVCQVSDHRPGCRDPSDDPAGD